MSTKITVRVPDDLYDKIKNVPDTSISECVIQALTTYFENLDKSKEPVFVYTEDQQSLIDILKVSLEESKNNSKILQNELNRKDEQLKIKDQQIFSLIAVQKDLTEKTTEQVKLLGDQMKSKKWYQFWK